MTDKEEQATITDAQAALAAVQQMETTARRQAAPPRWFGATIATLTGALVTLSAAGLNQYNLFIMLLMGIIIAYQSEKARVSITPFPSVLVGVMVSISMIVLFFLLIIAAQALSYYWGLAWAPLAAGILFGLIVFILTISEWQQSDLMTKGDAKK